ncbi:MAG: aminoacyl-tRNA hydrolase [Flavipsychrobacter sp.]
MKFLIVGLGNIGAEYDSTRHNIGFDVADAFVIKHEGTFAPDRYADVAKCKWKGRTFVVAKPTTYMNLSGKTVKYWMEKEKIALENILIIVDDLALPLGKLRIRGNGSDAGHNGLKHIQETLQTAKYPRLRFGIGDDFPKGKQVDFVLGKWTNEELEVLKTKIPDCVDAIETFATQGIARAMNAYNK